MMQYQSEIEAYFHRPDTRKTLCEAVSRLVAVRSVRGEAHPEAPFGPGPEAALEEALQICREFGFPRVQNYDHYVGLADLNEKPTQLHILGHLDVVGEGSGWHTDPYVCVEKDGILYGRGVSDDKGPVCAALLAMKAVQDLHIPLEKNVRLVMGTDEESGSSDIAYYYAREPYAPQTFTPDADFPVIHIEKGHYHPDFGASWEKSEAVPQVTFLKGGFRANVVPPEAEAHIKGLAPSAIPEIQKWAASVERDTGTVLTLKQTPDALCIHCTGRNAHAASPDDGLNAISALLELLVKLPLAECASTSYIRAMQQIFPFGDNRGHALGIAQSDEASGSLTLNLALMTLTETGFTAKFDVRYPLCANEENCAHVCEKTFARYGISILGDAAMIPPHAVPADAPFVQTLLRCYEVCTGETNVKPVAIGGGTYVHDIPGGVAFGCTFPGFDPKMHAPDEQASVDQLLLSAKIFALAITELCQ